MSKKQAIQKHAETATENTDEKKAAELQAIIVKRMTALNEEIDSQLDCFLSRSILLLRELYQMRPDFVIKSAVNHRDALRELIQPMINVFDLDKSAVFKQHIAETLHQVVDVVLKNETETEIAGETFRDEKRN
jgi:hypothetical protein